MTNPKYKLKARDIKLLKLGLGGCVATNRITVEGLPVRFMYRQHPHRENDSGWSFFSGIDEDDDYLNDTDNSAVFDVNTIANYDSSIVPYLDAPYGSAFERAEQIWAEVKDWRPPD